MRTMIFLAMMFALAGCAHAPKPTAASTSIVFVPICQNVATFTDAQESAMGAAIALPSAAPLVPALVDYGRIRAASRACKAANAKH